MFDRACVWHTWLVFFLLPVHQTSVTGPPPSLMSSLFPTLPSCMWGFWPWVLKPVNRSKTEMSRFAAGDPPKDLTIADVTHLHIEIWRGWRAANTQPTAETLLMRFIRPVEAVGDTGPNIPQESIPWEGIVTQGSAFECWSSFLLWDHHHITVASL